MKIFISHYNDDIAIFKKLLGSQIVVKNCRVDKSKVVQRRVLMKISFTMQNNLELQLLKRLKYSRNAQ